jgi:hypothetical protein
VPAVQDTNRREFIWRDCPGGVTSADKIRELFPLQDKA